MRASSKVQASFSKHMGVLPSPITIGSRWYHVTPPMLSPSSSSLNASYLFSLQTFHKKLLHQPQERLKCQRIELEAWNHLQGITDELVEGGTTVEVAELLSCWIYFSKFWSNGMNGPSLSSAEHHGFKESPPLQVPTVARESGATRKRPTIENATLPPRANPLDEILEF